MGLDQSPRAKRCCTPDPRAQVRLLHGLHRLSGRGRRLHLSHRRHYRRLCLWRPGGCRITFELGNGFFEDCSTFTSSIIDPALTSLMVAAKAARQPYRTPAGPEVIQASVTPTQVLAGGQVTLTVAIDSARYATNDPDFGIEPVQPITAAHYTVDAPGWISGTVAYSLTVVPTAPMVCRQRPAPSSTRLTGRRAAILF